jgi:hypothetical protein
MTIQYKNAGFSLDTTSVKTLFTCPTSGVAIIKSILIANDHSSDVAVKAALNDGTTYQFYQKTLTSDSSDDAVSGVLNLEAGDAVTAEANVSNVVTGVINYALMARS